MRKTILSLAASLALLAALVGRVQAVYPPSTVLDEEARRSATPKSTARQVIDKLEEDHRQLGNILEQLKEDEKQLEGTAGRSSTGTAVSTSKRGK